MKNNIKRAVCIFFAAVFIAAVFSSCAAQSDANKAFAYPIDGDPECIDPQIARSNSALIIINNCMEGLVRLDESGNIVNGVAENIEISPDGLVYTFKLGDDAKWYLFDTVSELLGKDFVNRVTAYDFAYGITRTVLKETNSPSFRDFFVIKNAERVYNGEIDKSQLGVQAVDASTLRITLNYADASFLELLTTAPAMPCNEKFFLATKGRYGLDIDHFISNGPFYASKWNEDASFLIKKNTLYGGQSKPVPASVNFYVNTDSSSIADKLKDGDFDAGTLSGEYADGLLKNDKIKYTQSKDTVRGLCFNTNQEYLKNINLRLALSVAANASDIAGKFSVPAENIIPDMCRVDMLNYCENASVPTKLSNNSVKAQEYWAKAIGELGVKSVSLTLTCGANYESEMRGLLQAWQKYFGLSLNVKIHVVEDAKIATLLKNGGFEIIFAPIKAENPDAVKLLNALPDKISYSSESYKSIIAKLNAAKKTEDKIRLCSEAENFLIQNAVFFPVCSQSAYFIMAKKVSGIYLSSVNGLPYFINARREGKD